MAKRRRGRKKIVVDPFQQMLMDLLGEVKQTVVGGLREIVTPKTPMFQESDDQVVSERPFILKKPEVIKDAEVISVRKG